MNVFSIRDKLISDYASFVTSYINARDPQIGQALSLRMAQ